MKWLNLIWPWKEIAKLKAYIDLQEKTRLELHDEVAALNRQVATLNAAHEKYNAQTRKMAQIIALKGGIL